MPRLWLTRLACVLLALGLSASLLVGLVVLTELLERLPWEPESVVMAVILVGITGALVGTLGGWWHR
jgi:hypothetical protein